MRTHGRRLVASLSACADVALLPYGGEPTQQRATSTLDAALSESWVHAGNSWCDALGAKDLALLNRQGISETTLRAALHDRMTARCAGALNHLDYFDGGVDNDPILDRWWQFLTIRPHADFVPSLSAHNYLVSREPVVAACRVAVWDDPAFMERVHNIARYQRVSEALPLRAWGGL